MVFEGFEDSSLKINFTQFNGGFERTTEAAFEGSHSFVSTNTTDESTSGFEFDINNSGTLELYYKISSEDNFDFGRIFINDSKVLEVSGDKGFELFTQQVAPNDTVRIQYDKDISESQNKDAFFIDNISTPSPNSTEGSNNIEDVSKFNKTKKLDVSSVDGTPTVDKAQPIILSGEGAFDVSTADFTDQFSVSTLDTTPQGLAFSNSGDKMFVVGEENDNIYEFFLTTSFDISTASITDSFDVSDQDTNPTGVAFSDSGDKMFVAGKQNENIYEYSLSESFNVTTASFTDSFDVSPQDVSPRGVAFSSSGDKMFMAGAATDTVYEFSLSTSFDVSTASSNGGFEVLLGQDVFLTGITFSSSGDKMFVINDSQVDILQFSLSSSFDVSTATLTEEFNTSFQTFFPTAVAFNDSGDKMFVMGDSSDANVHEYSLAGKESQTGKGDIVIDFTNVADAQDLAVFDQNGNLLDYEIESLDIKDETAVLWAYNSWVRDGSTQAQIAYGNNAANVDGQDAEATWNNSGQNTVMVQHLDVNATDSTDNDNDGSINGPTSTVVGQYAGAFFWDGTDDEIRVTDNSTLDLTSNFMIMFWAERRGGGGENPRYVSKDSGTAYGMLTDPTFNNSDRTMLFRFTSGGTTDLVDSGVTPPSGTYEFFAGGHDGSNVKIFADASEKASSAVSSIDTNNKDLLLGANPAAPDTDVFEGRMDEVRIYSEFKDVAFQQAELDASPNGGQVFFSQQSSSTTPTAVDISEAFTLDAPVSSELTAEIFEVFISEAFTLTAPISADLAAEISEDSTLTASISADSASNTETSYLQTNSRQVDFSLESSYLQEDSSVLNFDLQKELVKKVNISQFLSALDDVSTVFEIGNVISESLTADASISKTPRLTQDVSPSFDDSANVLSSKPVPEFVSPTDSFTRSAAKSLNQGLNLSDFKRLSAAQNISESFDTDETASVTHDAVRFFDEGVDLTADTPRLFYGDFVDESLSATSSVATLQDAERSLTQSITPGDSDIRGIDQKIGELIDAEPIVRRSTRKSLSESLAAGDFSQFELLVSLSQAAGVNDDASEFLRSSLPQSISVADTESRVFAGSRNLQQGFDLSVSINAFNSTFLSLTQSVSFLDSQSVTRDFSRTIFQEEEVGADAQKLLNRGVSESAAASDVETVLFKDLLSESTLFSDSEVMSVSLNQEQDLSVEDEFLSSSVLLRAFNQDFQVVASQSSLASQRLLESVPLLDTVFDAFSFEKFRSASEKVAVSSDSVVSLERVLSEDSAVADAVRFDSELFRRFEPVVSFDSFAKASQALSLAEVQRVSDAARKSFSSGLSEAAAVSDALTTKLPSSVIPAVADLSALRVAVAELSKPRGAFTDSESKP